MAHPKRRKTYPYFSQCSAEQGVHERAFEQGVRLSCAIFNNRTIANLR